MQSLWGWRALWGVSNGAPVCWDKGSFDIIPGVSRLGGHPQREVRTLTPSSLILAFLWEVMCCDYELMRPAYALDFHRFCTESDNSDHLDWALAQLGCSLKWALEKQAVSLWNFCYQGTCIRFDKEKAKQIWWMALRPIICNSIT